MLGNLERKEEKKEEERRNKERKKKKKKEKKKEVTFTTWLITIVTKLKVDGPFVKDQVVD